MRETKKATYEYVRIRITTFLQCTVGVSTVEYEYRNSKRKGRLAFET